MEYLSFEFGLAWMVWLCLGMIIPAAVNSLIEQGELTSARALLLQQAARTTDCIDREDCLNEADGLRRIMLDFSLSPEQMAEALKASIPDVTAADLMRWRDERWIQTRQIDGEMRFFRREPTNLLRHCPAARQRRDAAIGAPPASAADREELTNHIRKVMEEGPLSGNGLCCSTRYRVHHRVSVKPGVVQANEIVRCWLPVPRREPHMHALDVLSTEPANHLLAPETAPQRSIHLEKKAIGHGPIEFSISYEYAASASYREIDPDEVRPHETTSDLYRKFTAEQPPHIVFTPAVRSLVSEIVAGEENPYLRAKRIYLWMVDNIRYVNEFEYSTIPNISELGLTRRSGDCGVQALTFITLCRAAGVPARWESGWYPQPLKPNMHDWARFHMEPFGWLWADPSKGGQRDYDDPVAREFYFGNIDAFRLVANCEIGQSITPPKRFIRSEPVDFQRGEVETEARNLYFDEWDYSFNFEILNG